jgi:hypothetical protein
MDYLEDRLLASYFEAREHESYYNSLKHVDTRRDFHETIIPVFCFSRNGKNKALE